MRTVMAPGVLALLLAMAGPARAEVGAGPNPTSQAVAANAQFLAYAPPPSQPGVVCLVDSGVDPNPDTNAAVVGAEAEVPSWGTGDGLAQVNQLVEGHPAGHGTEMAMIMAAPENGWGMVGIAPTAVRVYSIRVVPPGVTTFPFSAYTYAINRCLKLHATSEPGINVVNLSFAGTATPSNVDLAQLEDAVDNARHYGINVVAAAGTDGASDYPAAYGPVLAVGASDAAAASLGVLCSLSKGDGLDVLAPGCNSSAGGIDEAFEDDGAPAVGFGTSQAAALTSSGLSAIRAYAPTLSVGQAEGCLVGSEHSGGNLDVAAAFTACGLGRLVGLNAAAPAPGPSNPSNQQSSGTLGGPVLTGTPVGSPPAAVPVLATPRLGPLRLRGRRLLVGVLNRPAGAAFDVRVLLRGKQHRSVVVASRRAAVSSMRFAVRSADAVEARFVVPGPRRQTSAWITKPVV